MKVLVLGGTGLIGSQVVQQLTAAGHEAVAASPSSGVNAVTGEGLDAALVGVDVVVDVVNAMNFDRDAAIAFFGAATGNTLAAEQRAGVGHHVALSIVGTDRFPSESYMAGKVEQERLINERTVPFTIVRATQFFEFLGPIADSGTEGDVATLSTHEFQPMASSDVAAAVVAAAVSAPVNGVVDTAGPERAPLFEIVARALKARGDARTVVADPAAGYFGMDIVHDGLVPQGEARIGSVTLDEWLAAQA